jgi:hypothetical protein
VLAMGGFNLAFLASELDLGMECIASALSMNSNLAFSWGAGCLIKVWRGEPEGALEHVSRAVRLSPGDPRNLQFETAAALAHFFAGRFDQAADLAEKTSANAGGADK